jgi:hypothetical protein
MNPYCDYLDLFFDELEIYEDLNRGHHYKAFIRSAIDEFLKSESKSDAFAVYDAFFSSYRITLEGDRNRFIDLLDVLRNYEENAAILIDKQRDHYIHAVNTFILGICIYSRNYHFREAFNTSVMDKTVYPNSYDTRHEEFFYRWGIASLFHDVGYPIEIIGKQLQKFLNFLCDIGDCGKIKALIEFENFDVVNMIPKIQTKQEFTAEFAERHPAVAALDLFKPVDLLAYALYNTLGVNLNSVHNALNSFVDTMGKYGFIDHGFYSAIVVLKWYGYLIQRCYYKPAYFYYPVLDSASAILLHNYYKNVIMKPPFSKGPLLPYEHPIAYLLILCDELQEWDREGYGILDRTRVKATDITILITDKTMDITYISEEGKLPPSFPAEKKTLLNKLLNMDAIFPDGFSVGSEYTGELARLAGSLKSQSGVYPRPLMENMEKLAIEIHKLYNQKELERDPEKPLEYPNFSDLPDSLKYSNLRQARGLAEKLDQIGYEILPASAEGEKLHQIPDECVDKLAFLEHDRWMEERRARGWSYGKVKNIEQKVSPYLIPYDQLSEEIKEKDRDFIRGMPALLSRIGMAAFQKSSIPGPKLVDG